MNTIAQVQAAAAAGYTDAANNNQNDKKTNKTAPAAAKESTEKSASAQKKSRVTAGRTIGDPQLSEKGMKYYEQLKKKYANMDFILVSEDKKAEAQANAGRYANADRMVVLIDTEKIERMAEDEEFRRQYEGIISSAAYKLPQLKESLGAGASCVKTYGMQVNDGGTASFFAVVDKSLAAQRERIEKKAAQKAETKKKEKKKAEQKRAEENRARKADEKRKAEKQGRAEKAEAESGDTVTVTASTIEELAGRIEDTIFALRSEYIQTEAERRVGRNFDFSI